MNAIIEPIAPTGVIFNPEQLTESGFEFMGRCWGNTNQPYLQLETQLGYICVVENQEVFLINGNRENKLEFSSTASLLEWLNPIMYKS